MKKAFYIIVFILLGSSMTSQVISEMQTIEGEWYIEITNPDRISFNKLHLAIKDSTKTAEIKQSVVEELQKENALVVITKDSLIEQWNTLPHQSFVYCTADDTVLYEDKGMQYYLPQTIDNLKYLDLNCMPLEGESIARIENTGMPCMPEYLGRSIPSLGEPNIWQNSFSVVEGQILDTLCYNGCDTLTMVFEVGDSIAKTVDCSTDISIDENGYFTFITYPFGCVNQTNSYSPPYEYHLWFNLFCENQKICDGICDPWVTAFNGNKSVMANLYPGVNTVYFQVFYMLSVSELTKNTTLTCSPNPASSYVKVEYSIVETASWKDCSIMISNNQGQAVLQTPIETPQGEVEIKLPSIFAKGMYYCSVAYKGQAVKTEQLMISD